MNRIRRVVVAALLAVWCFPAASMAKSAPTDPAPLVAAQKSTIRASSVENTAATESLVGREQQAQTLQDFKGGGAYIYVGSGTVLVLVIILLILLV